MTTLNFMPPQPPIEEQMRRWGWESFHKSILDKRDGLDYLIDFFEFINKNDPKNYGTDFYHKGYKIIDITKTDLHSHYFHLLFNQEDKSDRNI